MNFFNNIVKIQRANNYLFVLIFVFCSSAYGQQNVQPLKIGDDVPDALWNAPLQVVNHPEGKQAVTLADYKGKLIILDFWATYCTPCIRNFPKQHALQNEFGEKIKVLAVTEEDKEMMNKFFKVGAGREHTYVNSVIEDSVLSAYFSHRTIPHIVWIAPNGKVLNTTQAEYITKANIQSILDNIEVQMVPKIDIDPQRPLFLSELFTDDLKLSFYSIFIKGYYPGLPSGGNFRKTQEGKVYGMQKTNTTMRGLYNGILDKLFEKNGERFNSKRIIIDVKEPALLDVIEKKDGDYEKSNLYNYELIIPEEKADSFYYYTLADLNRYSEYTGTIEKREEDCFVLVRTSTKDKIKSKGGKPKFRYSTTHSILSNRPIGYMLNLVNSDTLTKLPIIDETGYTDNVDMEILGAKDLASMKKELNRYDLDLVPAKRNLNMFVLRDKQ